MIICMWRASCVLPESNMAALAAGLAAGVLSAACMPASGWILFGIVACGLACVIRRRSGSSTLLVLCSVYLLGALNYTVRTQVAGDDISRFHGGVTAFTGVVIEDPDIRADYVRLLLRVRSANMHGTEQTVSGLVMTTVPLRERERPPYDYGSTVIVTARPYIPFEATNPGQFSWKDYLWRRGIRCCARVTELDHIRLVEGKSGNIVVSAALSAKHHIASSIQRIHSPAQASVIIGMVLGTYAYLPQETFDNFSRTGTLHLLAASGFNCFLLVLLATPLLRLLKFTPLWSSVVIILLLILYLLIVGTKPSLVRATVMASLWLLAVPLRRVPNIRNLFFTAFVVALIARPYDLFDVGFQLSFAAVWALVTSGDLIKTILHRLAMGGSSPGKHPPVWSRRAYRWVGREIVAAAVATITVTLYTTPIVAYHFNYVSLVALPANIALALGVYVVFAVGMLAVAGASLPWLGQALGFVGSKATDAMLAVVHYLGSGYYSSIPMPSPGPLALLGYYLLLYVVLDYLRSLTDEG